MAELIQWRAARFTTDAQEAAGMAPFEGFTKGETWNGWDVPYFTARVAGQIIRQCADARLARFRVSDGLILVSNYIGNGLWDEEVECPGVPGPGGEGQLFSVGGGDWIWEEVD